MARKHLTALCELWMTVRAVFTKMYPDFVLRGKMDKDELPIFVYHRIRPEEFEAQLVYLKRNDYQTLTGDAFYDILMGKSPLMKPSVMLTFDDGFEDAYRVAFPLIKEYSVHAVVYLIPGWVGREGMLTWDQIREMHESGWVDFQSHSMSHASIFIGPELVDFYSPRHSRVRWNCPLNGEAGENRFNPDPRLGYPLFRSASRVSNLRRFIPDERLNRQCAAIVENDAKDFFNRRNWKGRLVRCIEEFTENEEVGRYETEDEQIDAILLELSRSKEAMENRLAGKTIRHFAYPWLECGDIAERALKEVGFVTSAVGMLKERRSNTVGSSPWNLVRVNGDFVLTLPGEGRKRFLSILVSKMVRRLIWGEAY